MELPQPTTAYGIWAGIGLAVMLGICLVFAFFARKRSATFDGFLVGHRDVGPIITGFALVATMSSGWVTLGNMGVLYSFGWSAWWFASAFAPIAIVLLVLFPGLKMRDYSARLGAKTVPDFIGIRFDSKLAQSLGAAIMIVLMILYAVGQFKAGATCWYAVTGLSPLVCLVLCALVALIYMVIGGYTGIQWGLALQGAILITAIFIFGILALSFIGGPAALNARLAEQNPQFLAMVRPELSHVGITQYFSGILGISAVFFLFITMTSGFPHNAARFLGLRKINRRELLAIVGIVFLGQTVVSYGLIPIGLSARVIFGEELLAIAPWKGDLAGPFTAMVIGGVPLTTLYVVGVFAAALSTLAAMVLIMASSVTRDIIQVWRPKTSDKSLGWLARALLVVFLFIPFYWTFAEPPELLAIFMSYAAMGLGAIFVFTIPVSFYWRRATKAGVIACMVYGFIATLVCGSFVSSNKLGVGTMEYILLIGCAACYFLGSLATSPPPQNTLDRVFAKVEKK